MRLEDSEGAEGPQKGRRIVGTLIPTTAVDQLVKMLGSGAEENEEIIHWGSLPELGSDLPPSSTLSEDVWQLLWAIKLSNVKRTRRARRAAVNLAE